jgi:hypothetical protein
VIFNYRVFSASAVALGSVGEALRALVGGELLVAGFARGIIRGVS